MKNYWNQLKPNERKLISISGIIIFILILYLFVLEPFMIKAEDLTVKVERQKHENEWLKKTSAEVKRLQASSSKHKTRKNPGQSLLVVVDRTAKKNKLANSLKRVEPDGTERVRVWLDNAAFDDVVKWLNILQSTYKLEIESAVFDKVETSGRVNVRLVFIEDSA